MGSLALGLALALLSACAPLPEPPAPTADGQIVVGRPLAVARPSLGQAGTDRWQLTVQNSQWIALMLMADAETSWTIDTATAQVIESGNGEGREWLVVAANSGETLTIDVAWSAAFSGSYLLAAAVPPSGIRGPHATAMRELYTLAELEHSLSKHAASATSLWLDHVLDGLSALAGASPLAAADVAAIVAQRQLQVGQTAIPIALCRQALWSLSAEDESLITAGLTLRGLLANALLIRSDYEPARQVYLQMDQTAARIGSGKIAVNVAKSLTTLDLLAAHPERAVAHLSELLSAVPPRVALPAQKLVLWTSLGIACESAGRLQQAAEALERALTLAPLPAEEASARVNLGRVRSRLGQSDAALEQYTRAAELAVASKEVQAHGGALSGLAELLLAAGQHASARAAAQQALTLFQDNLPVTGSCLSALHTLTALALQSGDAEAAEQYVERAHGLLGRGDPASLAVLERTGVPTTSAHWDDLAQSAAKLKKAGSETPDER